MRVLICLVLLILLFFKQTLAQEKDTEETAEESLIVDHSYTPMTLFVSEDRQKYIRFFTWHQIWAVSRNLRAQNPENDPFNFALRRSRFLAYMRVSPRFMILTHFGVNNLTPQNMDGLGNRNDAAQLFLHDAWGEFLLFDQHHMGAGLHYWKGLTRLSSESTLNFMTLDQTRPFIHWHSLGITDQFARHIGVYAKGEIGKLHYRMALNNPINPENAIGGGNPIASAPFPELIEEESPLIYEGSEILDQSGNAVGNYLFEGYFKYDFWEKENHKFPYFMGSYLGNKKIFMVGAGFFAHPNAMYNLIDSTHSDVFHFAADAYLDYPMTYGTLNAYISLINFDYGENYMSRWAGTGQSMYTHAGFFIKKIRTMPYIAYQVSQFDALKKNSMTLDVGVNYFLSGHNAKLTLELHNIFNNPYEGIPDPETGENLGLSQIRLQAHLFI